MASDIVKRIRALRPSTAIEREAADEIERLRAELAETDKRLRHFVAELADRDALIAEALAESTTEAALYDGGTLGKRMAKILSRAPQGAADRVRAEAAAEALGDAAEMFYARLPDGTGNGRAYNSYTVGEMLCARAVELREKAGQQPIRSGSEEDHA